MDRPEYFTTERKGDVELVRLAGVTDIEAGELDEAIGTLAELARRPDVRLLAIDFTDWLIMNSHALRMIVSVRKPMAEKGGRLALCGVRPELELLMRISRVDQLVPHYPTEDEAIGALKEAPEQVFAGLGRETEEKAAAPPSPETERRLHARVVLVAVALLVIGLVALLWQVLRMMGE